eukprot:10572227-Karenia_brevis.AAC.1
MEEDEEGVDSEEVGAEDPERLRLQEESEVVKKIGDPMLPSEEECLEAGVGFVSELDQRNGTTGGTQGKKEIYQNMRGII